MKIRVFLFAALAVLLSACNMTLAADVTPPPDYVPPTPVPTLGPLYPAQPMNVENGARIYAEKCAACHGERGLGDGAQGKSLPVKVAPIGLADFAAKASPAAWYKTVTRGNIERFMPPFASLTDQQRWDVVGYALTLSVKTEEVEKGKRLAQASCPECEAYFSALETSAALTGEDLIAIAQNGNDAIPPFGKNLSAQDLSAVAAYLRSLSFAAPTAKVEATPAPETAASPEPASAAPQSEPAPAESAAPTEALPEGVGTVRGSIENQSDEPLPADATITLRAYDHSGEMTSGPTLVETLEGKLNPDGSFTFENVNLPERRIFVAEAAVNGVKYQSPFALVEAGMTEVTLKPIVVFASTDDFSVLKIASLQIFFDYSDAQQTQMIALYNIVNASGKTVTVDMSANSQEIPFIAAPSGAQPLGFDAAQDSAPFAALEKGFAMPPSETPYGLVAFYSLPRDKKIEISLPLRLAADETLIYLPEGVKLASKAFTDQGARSEQGMNLHLYSAAGMAKDSKVEFTLSGSPQIAGEPTSLSQNNNLLIGVGAFGAILILAGVWLYLRDARKAGELDEDEEEDEEDVEDVLDAIVALDDLHRAGKISDEAYRARREELKSKLKRHD